MRDARQMTKDEGHNVKYEERRVRLSRFRIWVIRVLSLFRISSFEFRISTAKPLDGFQVPDVRKKRRAESLEPRAGGIADCRSTRRTWSVVGQCVDR